MPKKELDYVSQGLENDWEGNNVAFTCPVAGCGKVFIVSELLHRSGRKCPGCEKSTGHVSGGKKSGGKAYLEW
jgi:hypothetical protein